MSGKGATIEVKCKLCETWYVFEKEQTAVCPQCSFPAQTRIKQDPPIEIGSPSFSLDLNRSLLPAKESDGPIFGFFKQVVNFFFMLYLLIMALISWIAITFSG